MSVFSDIIYEVRSLLGLVSTARSTADSVKREKDRSKKKKEEKKQKLEQEAKEKEQQPQ